MGKKILLIDITRCNGCYNCQLSCKDEHVGNDWSPIAKPQPNTGHFWYRITETTQGSVPKVRVHYMHTMCQHCDNCKLIEKYPDCVYRTEEGMVIIDPEKSFGKLEMVHDCPYGAVYYNTTLMIPQKCTGCVHLLRDENWTDKEPRCVQSCPVDVFTFGDEDSPKIQEKLATGEYETYHPEYGMKTHVFYKGLLNKFFIAGDVYDPVEDEVIEHAKVTLIDSEGHEVAVQETDWAGDFNFHRNEPGIYSVKIEADGFEQMVIENIDAREKDLNIGSFAMKRSDEDRASILVKTENYIKGIKNA